LKSWSVMPIKKELYSGHSIDYAFPLFYNEKDRHLFYDENFSNEIPSIQLHILNHVRFDMNTVAKGFEVMDQYIRHNPTNRFNQVKRSVNIRFQKVKVRGNVILGFQVWGNNYFHWMTETVPAIHAMYQQDINPLVLIPESLFQLSFVKQLFEMNLWKYETFCNDEAIEAASMFAIPLPHVGRFNHYFLRSAVQKLISQSLVDESIIPFRKVYISRYNARRRKVTNEVEMVHMLRKMGFEIHMLENYSLKQQIQLFQESALVLSNHGAGLTNIMFMKPESKVLELKSENNDYWCYYSLANVFGLKYAYKLCLGNDKNHRDADVFVDLSNLFDILNQIESSKEA
jgi:capsular polysaccharide biosynthesis protein